MCSFLVLLAIFFANFATIKKFFQKSKHVHHPRTRRHLCAKVDILKPSHSWDIIWRKKLPAQTDTQLILSPVHLSALCWRITSRINNHSFSIKHIWNQWHIYKHTAFNQLRIIIKNNGSQTLVKIIIYFITHQIKWRLTCQKNYDMAMCSATDTIIKYTNRQRDRMFCSIYHPHHYSHAWKITCMVKMKAMHEGNQIFTNS